MSTRDELLEYLWTEIINSHLSPEGLTSVISSSKRDPNGPFADTGPALERLLALVLTFGITPTVSPVLNNEVCVAFPRRC